MATHSCAFATRLSGTFWYSKRMPIISWDVENLKIRSERIDDHRNVEGVHDLAFKSTDEAELVRQLRHSDAFVPDLSIVAELDDVIVGHVLFSKITIVEGDR